MSELPERLRTLSDAISNMEWDLPITAPDDCMRAANEIERLQLENNQLHAEYGHAKADAAEARTEIERLRVRRFRVYRDRTPGSCYAIGGWCYSFYDHFELHWDDGTHEMWRTELSTDGTRKREVADE